jgi:hypothetical protein
MLNKKEDAIKYYQAALKYSRTEEQKSKIQAQLELFNH